MLLDNKGVIEPTGCRVRRECEEMRPTVSFNAEARHSRLDLWGYRGRAEPGRGEPDLHPGGLSGQARRRVKAVLTGNQEGFALEHRVLCAWISARSREGLGLSSQVNCFSSIADVEFGEDR